MGATRYFVREAAKFYLGARAPWTYPDLWFGLLTVTPTDPDGAATEASGYSRIHTPDTGSDPDWQRIVDAGQWQVRNTRGLTLGPLPSGATVTGWGLWDAATDGNLLMSGALTAPLAVPAGRRRYFPPGAVTLARALRWQDGPLVALMYLLPQSLSLGPPTYQQPASWQVYPLTKTLTHDDYLRDYSGAPAGKLMIANDTTQFPLDGADVTNGAAWAFDVAATDGPDFTGLLLVAQFGSGAYAPYWQAQLTQTATLRAGERLEIAAGSLRVYDL